MERFPAVRVWWLKPGTLFGVLVTTMILAAWLVPEGVYVDLWRTEKYVDMAVVAFALGCAVVFGLGCLLGGLGEAAYARGRAGGCWGADAVSLGVLSSFFWLSTALAVLGYVLWAGVAWQNGVGMGLVAEALQGKPGAVAAIRSRAETVGGLTTMTQFAIAAGVLGPLVVLRRPSSWIWRALLFILVLALLRGQLRGERLALIEIVVPTGILLLVYGAWWRHWMGRWAGVAAQCAPLVGVLALYLFFTVSESARSWSSFYSWREDSVWEFSAYRLLGYYLTALNNGALLVSELPTPAGPYYLLAWFWRFPFVEGVLPAEQVLGFHPGVYLETLARLANPELNNQSGLFAYVFDLGRVGGVVAFVFMGMASGFLFQRFIRGALSGMLFYPLVFLGILEVCRVPILTSQRMFPAIVMLVGAWLLVSVRLRRKRSVLR